MRALRCNCFPHRIVKRLHLKQSIWEHKMTMEKKLFEKENCLHKKCFTQKKQKAKKRV